MRRARYAGHDFARAVNIEDLRHVARRRLPHFSFEYVEGGAEDEITLQRNRDVFARIPWVPRTLAATGRPDLGTEILGQRCYMPIGIAPTGFNGLLWREGDLALARAAAAAGIPFTLSTAANCSLARLGDEVKGQNWFQLYPLKNEKDSDRLMDRARDAGCRTLMVTTDAPILGAREWDQRNYNAPMKLTLLNKLDVLAHPGWIRRVMFPGGAPRFENILEFLPADAQSALLGARYFATQFNDHLSWADIARMRARWTGKLVVKGVLGVDDARRAVETGVDGIVISNHGGRQLDSCVSAMEMLPAIAAAVGDRLCLLVDGGFQRGSEVLKALALGAQGVLVGRAALYGLAAGGEAGVSHALNILRMEMERTMMLLGCRAVDDLGGHLIRS